MIFFTIKNGDRRFFAAGQSLVEVLVAMAVGSLFVIAVAGVIAPLLKTNTAVSRMAVATGLAKELLDNVTVAAEGNWHVIDSLATTSVNVYHLDASSSPFSAVAGAENITLGTTTYSRDFYVDSVSRDGSGNITASGGTDDPSTKRITVEYSWPQAPTATVVMYLTRYGDNVVDETDWSGGPGQDTPVTSPNGKFSTSTGSIDYSSLPGSLYLTLPIAFVQDASADSLGATQSACSSTFSSATRSGDLIIATVSWTATTTVPTISDDAGNTYAAVVGPVVYAQGGSLTSVALFYAKNITGTSNHAITATLAVSGGCDLGIFEYAGLNRGSPLDQFAIATGTASDTPASGGKTTTSANELIFGWIESRGGLSGNGTGSGFTGRVLSNDSIIEDMIVASTGTYAATISVSGSSTANWAASLATFKQ